MNLNKWKGIYEYICWDWALVLKKNYRAAVSQKLRTTTLKPMNSVEVGQFTRLRHAACYLIRLIGSSVYFYVFHKTALALYSIRETIRHEASYGVSVVLFVDSGA